MLGEHGVGLAAVVDLVLEKVGEEGVDPFGEDPLVAAVDGDAAVGVGRGERSQKATRRRSEAACAVRRSAGSARSGSDGRKAARPRPRLLQRIEIVDIDGVTWLSVARSGGRSRCGARRKPRARGPRRRRGGGSLAHALLRAMARKWATRRSAAIRPRRPRWRRRCCGRRGLASRRAGWRRGRVRCRRGGARRRRRSRRQAAARARRG